MTTATRDIKIQLYPQQDDFVMSDAPFSAFIAGIGSGKTIAGVLKGLLYSQEYPGSLGLVGAPTYPMLRDATLRTLFEIFPKEIIGNYNKGDMVLTMTNGSEILLRSVDDPERLRGPNLAWYMLDEGSQAKRDAWLILQGRLRQAGYPHRGWTTCTPKGYNWVWQEFGKEVRSDYFMVHASTADNPFLPADYLTKLKEAYANDPEFSLQELEGQFVIVGGRLFFNLQRLKDMQEDISEPIETREGCISVWKPRIVGKKYVYGGDPCWGEKGSYACGWLLDWQTGEQVAGIHGRLMPDEFADKSVKLCKEYNNAFLGCECNGEGKTAVDKMIEIGYKDRMYHRDDKKEKPGWFTSGSTTRPVMLAELEEAVRLSGVVVHSGDTLSEMYSFVRGNDGKAKATEGAYDDQVMAMAIAWQMRKYANFGLSVPLRAGVAKSGAAC